jgi:hypothetical protein
MSDLDRLADEIAELLGVDPEAIATEPRLGRVSLDQRHAKMLISMIRKETP